MRPFIAAIAIGMAIGSASANAQTGGANTKPATARDQQLRDPAGRMIGRIRINPDGARAIYDPAGRLLGKYDSASNTTRDVTGRIIGRGDLLVKLLKH